MIRILLLSFSISCTLSLVHAQTVFDQRYYDARAIHDVARLPFDRIARETNEMWMVTTLDPAPYSGSARIVGDPPQLKTYSDGTWDRVVSLGTAVGMSHGKYSHEEAVTYHGRKTDINSIYSPLDKGGIVLCRLLGASKTGNIQSTELYLVPTEWRDFMDAAYVVYVRESQLFSSSSETNQQALVALLQADNPVVSVLAFQRLLQNEHVDSSLLIDSVARSQGTLAATLGYMLITAKRHDQDVIRSQLVGALSDNTRSKDLESLTRSVFSAALLHGKDQSTKTLCAALVPIIRRGLSDAGIDAKKKSALDHILNDMDAVKERTVQEER